MVSVCGIDAHHLNVSALLTIKREEIFDEELPGAVAVLSLVLRKRTRLELTQVDMHIDDWASPTPGPASHKRPVRDYN